MALKSPDRNEINRIASLNKLELSADELDALERIIPAQLNVLERLDAITAEPRMDSGARYPDRTVLGRPDEKNDPLNAIVMRCIVKGASAGKLKGMRIGLKDSVCVAGIPATGGSAVLEGFVPDVDATIVTRMLDAGAEIVAMLNMDDFALSGDGRTSHYGPVRNPHNPAYCSGGSSCGSGAALYYDGIDATIGTDQGGSIRIPASWSGVVGIKPTYGLVPYTGVMSIDPSLDHVGPMARSVDIVARLLEVIAGKDPLDQRQREVAVEPYRELLKRGIAGLKIGVVREGFAQPGAEPDVSTAVMRAVAALAKHGAKASEISIPEHNNASDWIFAIVPQGMAMLAHSKLMGTHHSGAYLPKLGEHFGEGLAARGSDTAITVKLMLILGEYLRERYHGRLYAKAQNLRGRLTMRYDEALKEYDVLAMPATPMKARRIDDNSPYSMITNTAPFDVTGHPALSVPCAKSNGLPVGLMLVGRHFQDATILRLAHAYEQAVDWQKV
jgi:amidase